MVGDLGVAHVVLQHPRLSRVALLHGLRALSLGGVSKVGNLTNIICGQVGDSIANIFTCGEADRSSRDEFSSFFLSFQKDAKKLQNSPNL